MARKLQFGDPVICAEMVRGVVVTLSEDEKRVAVKVGGPDTCFLTWPIESVRLDVGAALCMEAKKHAL